MIESVSGTLSKLSSNQEAAAASASRPLLKNTIENESPMKKHDNRMPGEIRRCVREETLSDREVSSSCEVEDPGEFSSSSKSAIVA